MISIPDNSELILTFKFDTAKINWANSSFHQRILGIKPVLIVMDYAFGEQARND
jgi:hypothetical protein